ncbi:MAG: hypothetical protein AB8B53_04985 [Flavobacteriales bacterium]
MLRNVSYNDPKIKREIRKAVGESYSWAERLKCGGTGSPKLKVLMASREIAERLEKDNYSNNCNIEICYQGIIIRFRSILETYGLIIPFYKLSLFKSDADSYSIFSGKHKVVVAADNPKVHAFFKRLLDLKVKQSNTRIEDL